MTPVLGLYGGSFDPPHLGHVELARRAKLELGLERLLVLVSADPGHKHVDTPADIRLQLVQAAFPDDEVELDSTPRTIDLLRAHPEWVDPFFLIGADQFSDFPTWKEPGRGAAARPARGRDAARLSRTRSSTRCSRSSTRPDRVIFFEIEPMPISSRDAAPPARRRRGRLGRAAAGRRSADRLARVSTPVFPATLVGA